jgi:hypothetical protein
VTADACVDDLSGPLPVLCVGASVGGACWFLGSYGDSCDQTCANQGAVYDDATETYAGSSGTDLQCQMVLNALGSPGPVGSVNGFGLGCFVDLLCVGNNCRDVSTTTSGASFGLAARACACR